MLGTTDNGQKVVLNQDGTWHYQNAGLAKADNRHCFRKTYWGMHAADVKQSETSVEWIEGDGFLAFESTLTGNSCLVVFVFLNGILVRGKYVFNQDFANANTYLSKFDELKASLQKKYPLLISDDEYWVNDLFRDDYQNWGTAVSAGHMSRFTNWADEETNIFLSLTGEGYQCTLSIEYSAKAHEADEAKHKEALLLDML